MIYDLQKASLIKRLSAFLFDLIIFCVLAVGIAVLISTLVGYDAKLAELEASYIKYGEDYGIELNISSEEFEKLTDAEKKQYELASEAFADDREVAALNSLIFNLTLIMISISTLTAFMLLELLIPLFFKNGQTLGKKIFGVALMRTDGVKVSFFQLFVRAILGKYTIETMVPILILLMFFMGAMGFIGILVPILLLILEIIIMIITNTNSLIHDLLAVTVAVDINTQMIFDSQEQLIEYKKKKAAEAAQKRAY